MNEQKDGKDVNMERCYSVFLQHGVFMKIMPSAPSNKSLLVYFHQDKCIINQN